MIVKNEEKHLFDCLESVQGIVDEIIIVDTGSTDNTKKIAENFGAKIFDFKWVNDFAAARNFALEKSSGDHILYMDADERLSKNSGKKLKELASKKNKKAYRCIVTNIDNINGRLSSMTYTRFFPKSEGVEFEFSVHEQIDLSLARKKIPIVNSEIEIIHLGYSISKDELKRKAERNLNILLDDFQKNPHPYTAYQAGQAFGILENKIEAAKYFKLSLEYSGGLTNSQASIALRYIGGTYFDNNDLLNAEKYLNKSLKYDSSQPLALFTSSFVAVKLGNKKSAENFAEKAYEINCLLNDKKLKSAEAIYIPKLDAAFHCINVAIQIGNREMFNNFYKIIDPADKNNVRILELFEIIINNKSEDPDKAAILASAVINNSLEPILNLLNGYSDNNFKLALLKEISRRISNSKITNMLGLYYLSIKDFLTAKEYFEKSLLIDPRDPSPMFYLISLHINTENYAEIDHLIKITEEKFKDHTVVMEKLNIIKEKLLPVM
jgi:glycosyltransferase involved in cell wall biosynthesis